MKWRISFDVEVPQYEELEFESMAQLADWLPSAIFGQWAEGSNIVVEPLEETP